MTLSKYLFFIKQKQLKALSRNNICAIPPYKNNT